MSNKNKPSTQQYDLYNPTLHDGNRARERQVVIDPERGPENKGRKR